MGAEKETVRRDAGESDPLVSYGSQSRTSRQDPGPIRGSEATTLKCERANSTRCAPTWIVVRWGLRFAGHRKKPRESLGGRGKARRQNFQSADRRLQSFSYVCLGYDLGTPEGPGLSFLLVAAYCTRYHSVFLSMLRLHVTLLLLPLPNA